jgi:hypothetical protein
MDTNIYIFDHISEWEIFQAEVAEKSKTHILCSKLFSENLAVMEIMWENFVEADRPQMTI